MIVTALRPDGDIVACDNLVRIYSVADVEVVALQGVRSEHVTAIVATHDPAMLDVADRVVELRDGRLVSG